LEKGSKGVDFLRLGEHRRCLTDRIEPVISSTSTASCSKYFQYTISSFLNPRTIHCIPRIRYKPSYSIPSDHHVPEALYHDTSSLSTSQLQQSRSSPLVSSMVFNQESPYPVHVLPSNATRRHHRTASQTSCRRRRHHHNHHQNRKRLPCQIDTQIQAHGRFYKSIANRATCGLEESITYRLC
jgi:hypothetical protein